MTAEKTDRVERNLLAALAQSEELVELLRDEKQRADATRAASLEREIQERERQNEILRELLERARVGVVEPERSRA